MKILLAALLVFSAAIAHADTITPNYGFIIPTTNSLGWAPKVDDWAIKLDTGAAWLTKPDTFQSSVTLNANLLLNSGAQLTVNSPAAWFQDFSSSGNVSINSTDTFSHSTYGLTIGNSPNNGVASILMRSTDTVAPQFYGQINGNGAFSPINFQTGITIPSGATAGLVNLFNLTQLQQLQVNDGGAAAAVQVEGGVQAGCGAGFTGCVGIVSAAGQIPAINSTYFASLNGSALTGIPSTGSIVGVYLPLSAGSGQVITGALYQHMSSPFLQMQDTSDTDGTYLGDILFGNPTSNRHQIISTGQNASGILGMEGMLIVGAAATVDTAGGNRGVVLAGHETLQPDLFVSTYSWVAIGSTNPVTNGTSGLWVGGNIVSTGNVTGASVTSLGTLAAVGVLEGFSGGFVQGGNFGIYTQTPQYALDVNGVIQSSGTSGGQINIYNQGSGTPELYMGGPGNISLATIILNGQAVNATEYRIRQGNTGVTNGGMEIYDLTNSAPRLTVSPSGPIGIENSNPGTALDVSGVITARSAGGFARFTGDNAFTNVTNTSTGTFVLSSTSYGSGIGILSDGTNNENVCVFLYSGVSSTAGVVIIAQTGTEYASPNTGASGKTSLSYTGSTSTLQVLNQTGGAVNYSLTLFSSK